MTKLSILGVIPARYASSRYPGKPLIDIKGKSMIQRVYEGCKKSTLIDELVVATDDQRIFDHVLSFGGKVQMTSTSHTSGTDRCAEVATSFPNMEVVINIQGDEPLVDYRQIEQLILAFENEQTQIATLGIEMVNPADLLNPNRIKLVTDHQSNALYFSRSPIPSTINSDKATSENFPFLRHIGLYAYRNNTLQDICQAPKTELEKIESLEQLRWLYHGWKIKVVPTSIETPNIDVPEDLAKVLSFL
jgi:3-deoxy-manno-octulosonate cytidylyltransferase (CMP-KDO synthetase)